MKRTGVVEQTVLLCLMVFAWILILVPGCKKSSPPPTTITGADGLSYVLVKPEVRMEDGAFSIAEYARQGDTNHHYFMRMSKGGQPPYFSRLDNFGE